MAYKKYYIKKDNKILIDTKILINTSEFFYRMDTSKKYNPIGTIELGEGHEIWEHDLRSVGMLSNRRPVSSPEIIDDRVELGDIEFFGKSKDIMREKKKLENITDCKLKLIKQ